MKIYCILQQTIQDGDSFLYSRIFKSFDAAKSYVEQTRREECIELEMEEDILKWSGNKLDNCLAETETSEGDTIRIYERDTEE